MSDKEWIKYQCFCYFKMLIFIRSFLRNWLAHFLFLRSNEETDRNKHLLAISFNVIVNRALSPSHVGSLEIRLTIPLTFPFRWEGRPTLYPRPTLSTRGRLIDKLKTLFLRLSIGIPLPRIVLNWAELCGIEQNCAELHKITWIGNPSCSGPFKL